MKIGIVGANGKQGSMLAAEAKKRGHFVVAFVRNSKNTPDCVDKTVERDLLSLTAQDVEELDVLISAVGFGFNSDPTLNRKGIDRLIEIGIESGVRIMVVGGAGSLYADATHTKRIYEGDGYPDFLYGISKNMLLGYEDMKNSELKSWCYVCPSLEFEYERAKTGEYKIGSDEVIYNSDGKSVIGYADYASAMIDEAENRAHDKMMITVCEK